jgi:hypothetical protein
MPLSTLHNPRFPRPYRAAHHLFNYQSREIRLAVRTRKNDDTAHYVRFCASLTQSRSCQSYVRTCTAPREDIRGCTRPVRYHLDPRRYIFRIVNIVIFVFTTNSLPGANSDPKDAHPTLMDFLKRQVPGAKYILSVCTGSWLLAGAGFLTGKRATTNKMLYTLVEVRMFLNFLRKSPG